MYYTVWAALKLKSRKKPKSRGQKSAQHKRKRAGENETKRQKKDEDRQFSKGMSKIQPKQRKIVQRLMTQLADGQAKLRATVVGFAESDTKKAGKEICLVAKQSDRGIHKVRQDATQQEGRSKEIQRRQHQRQTQRKKQLASKKRKSSFSNLRDRRHKKHGKKSWK